MEKGLQPRTGIDDDQSPQAHGRVPDLPDANAFHPQHPLDSSEDAIGDKPPLVLCRYGKVFQDSDRGVDDPNRHGARREFLGYRFLGLGLDLNLDLLFLLFLAS